MKIKLFLTTSLSFLGLWLVAAYLHTSDLESYTQSGYDLEPASATVEINTEADQEDQQPEFQALTAAK